MIITSRVSAEVTLYHAVYHYNVTARILENLASLVIVIDKLFYFKLEKQNRLDFFLRFTCESVPEKYFTYRRFCIYFRK